MKRFFKVMVAAMAVVLCALAFTLAGCSKEDAIKKAFEKEGYTVTIVSGEDSASTLSAFLSDEEKDNVKNYDVMTCAKIAISGGGSATIIKCPSAAKVKENLGDKYDSAKGKGLVNGDCYLVLYTGGALDIFKKA